MIKKYGAIVGSAVLLSAAAGFVTIHEGIVLSTYKDPVGVTTACVGHVSPELRMGMVFTKEDCDTFLKQDLNHAISVIDRSVKVKIEPETKIALASFVFNVGEGNFRRSTLLKKLNSGDIIGACNQLPRWVYAKGKKLSGLVKRREEERKLCLKGAQT